MAEIKVSGGSDIFHVAKQWFDAIPRAGDLMKHNMYQTSKHTTYSTLRFCFHCKPLILSGILLSDMYMWIFEIYAWISEIKTICQFLSIFRRLPACSTNWVIPVTSRYLHQPIQVIVETVWREILVDVDDRQIVVVGDENAIVTEDDTGHVDATAETRQTIDSRLSRVRKNLLIAIKKKKKLERLRRRRPSLLRTHK